MLRAGVDLRPLLARERRAAPAVLVVAAWGALAAAPNAPYAWLWFMVVAASALGRVWIGITPERDRLALQPRDPGGLLYAGSYALDVTLWGLLFTAVAVPARLLDHGVGFAAGATLLLGALTLGGWRAAWLGWIAGWGAVALVVNLLTGVSHPVALGLPLWLAAVAWMSRRSSGGMHRPGTLHASRTTKLSTLHATRSHAPTLGASTRFEGPTGIGVLPTPVLVVRHSRIAEANQAAAQVLGHAEHALIGKRIDECMDVDPAHAFDPEHARVDKTAVRVTPKGNGAGAWMARVRVVEPGHAASAVVVALTRPVAAADGGGIAAEAQRFALGVGGARARPWYRDEAGRLVVPSGMVAPSVDGSRDPAVFPLRYCLVPADQARADALWRTARELGGVFDELLTLVDARGAKRTVRIVCVPRGPGGDVNVAPAGLIPAVVGALAPPRGARTFNEPLQPQLQEQLPILAWLVDPAGRVVHVQGNEPWRWGMQREATERPLWWEAFELRNGAKVDIQTAMQNALAGKPTFDLVNARRTRSGGQIILRSHFVPYRGEGGLRPAGVEYAGTLVLDTIASAAQLSEIDRLRRSRAQYRALVEASTNFIWACDAHFRFTFVSRAAARDVYGYEPEELVGQSVAMLLAPGATEKDSQQALARLRLGQAMRNVEMVQSAKSGSRVVVAVTAKPMKTCDGSFGGAIGMNVDLTVLKLRERRLTEALRIERTVLDSAGQAIAVVKDGLVARCNDAFMELLQTQPALLQRTPIADYFATVDEWRGIAAAADAARGEDRAAVREVQIRRGSRAKGLIASWCQLTARSIAPGEYVVVLADIDQIRQREADALHEAHHDDLTGLPNRRLMSMRAATALAATALRNARCALMTVDLDGFKEINDQFGHEVGDQVLRTVAQRLGKVMRPQDTVARRGGDEFALLIPDVGARHDAERIAQRVLHAIEQPIVLDGEHYGVVSGSVGVAIAPEHGQDLERLLQLADLAMYEAKLRGKNCYAFAVAGGNVTASAPHTLRLLS